MPVCRCHSLNHHLGNLRFHHISSFWKGRRGKFSKLFDDALLSLFFPISLIIDLKIREPIFKQNHAYERTPKDPGSRNSEDFQLRPN